MRPPQILSRRLWACALTLLVFFATAPSLAQMAMGGGAPVKRETFTNSVGMTFVSIPAGSFTMGTTSRDKRMIELHQGDTDEEPAHKVTITRGFLLGQTEVTQGQWKAVMGTTPWRGENYVQDGDDYPAVYVSWEDAQAFCRRLSEKEGKTYRLPTEAEWEYACRAGTSTKYSFGDDENRLGDHAWFNKNTVDAGEKYAHRVATKKPNPWGLYDLHGNVWEWCQDWLGDYSSPAQTDPDGPSSGPSRVLRGGSWCYYFGYCRTAYRYSLRPDARNYSYGFRVLCSAPKTH